MYNTFRNSRELPSISSIVAISANNFFTVDIFPEAMLALMDVRSLSATARKQGK